MAPSGSGKTTLFKVLLGLDAADAGVVTGIAPGQIAAMFQEERLCEALTPVENVLLVCPRGTRRARVRSLLSRILPEDSLDRPVSQLSGGMRRRVSLARAVAYPSRMLLLDEPFTGLDAVTKGRVIEFCCRSGAGARCSSRPMPRAMWRCWAGRRSSSTACRARGLTTAPLRIPACAEPIPR
ncbi:MAG: ATP-binding cassette domain-containing protein [Collinsella sp.]